LFLEKAKNVFIILDDGTDESGGLRG